MHKRNRSMANAHARLCMYDLHDLPFRYISERALATARTLRLPSVTL